MVYVDSFDSFTDKAKVIYKEAPEKTRFSTKYRCGSCGLLHARGADLQCFS